MRGIPRILVGMSAGWLGGLVWAADVYWQGANTTVGAVTDTDVNSGVLWSDAAVPDGSDTAWFDWTQTAAAQWTSLVIDGAFDPGSMAIRADADAEPHVSTEVQLQLAKDLELEALSLIFGYQQTGGDNNLAVASGKTLSLTGSIPLVFGGHRGCWASISLNPDATLEFPGAAYTFNAYNTNYAHSFHKAQGFRPMSGLNGYVDFTGEGAAITLGDISGYSQRYPQALVPPCIDVGYQALRVRSDQSWSNPSRTGLVRLSVARAALLPDAQHNRLVTSISPDGLLPDLSEVPFFVQRTDREGNASTFRIPAGSYQSLVLYSSGHDWTHGVTTLFDGDVTLSGGTLRLLMDGTYAAGVEETDISLYFQNNDRAQYIYLNGHTITTARGVLLENNGLSNYAERMYVITDGATLNIGGDLVYNAKQGYAGSAEEQFELSLSGDADTVINLQGDFRTNVRARNVDHLSLSTVNLLGGSALSPNTFEVADDPASSVGPKTYAIGVLNVGTSAVATAHVRLVNANLNERSTGDKEGEILLAGTLSIRPGSTLDLNGEGVKVAAALAIDAGGTLDLNTGRALGDNENVAEFIGVGDQTAVWQAFQARVVDSSNPDFTFRAVQDGTYTYWQANPPPSGTVISVR